MDAERNSMHKALADLDSRWREEGIVLVSPAPAHVVNEVLEGIGIPFATDVVDFFSRVGGFAGVEMDCNCLTLWPLNRVARENRPANSPLLQFADFLIDSHRFALCRETQYRSSVWLCDPTDNQRSYMLVHSLASFLHTYAHSEDKMSVLHVES